MAVKKFVALCIRLIFALLSILPSQNTIAFLSRQSAHPFDFALLEPQLKARYPDYSFKWACVAKGGQLGLGLFLRQLYLVATSKLCLVDGYVPAVSIPKHHRSACIQMWHASGAIKKFGYQCLDTPAGRSSADAEAYRMHKGYDYVIAGMQGAADAFSEAFDIEAEKILPLGLPRLDYLFSHTFAEQRAQDTAAIVKKLDIKEGSKTRLVLYAPTFRKGNANPHWLQDNVTELSQAFANQDVIIVVAGHPLEEALVPVNQGLSGVPVVLLGVPTIEAIPLVDLVVSDYSAIALDAGAYSKQVYFYVPDIEEYRQSPGLNIDPLNQFSDCAFTSAHDLALAIQVPQASQATQALQASQSSQQSRPNTFASYMDEYAGNVKGTSINAIMQLISGII